MISFSSMSRKKRRNRRSLVHARSRRRSKSNLFRWSPLQFPPHSNPLCFLRLSHVQREEKTQDSGTTSLIPAPKGSKSRKALAALANGGVEEPVLTAAQPHAASDSPMRRVVEFIASPSCLLFPEHSPEKDEPDIKIEQKDLVALVECGSANGLMAYLQSRNKQITEHVDAAKCGVKLPRHAAVQALRRPATTTSKHSMRAQ
jgi:hypothetical protein